jgi:RNA polymerase sigma factor (sigma-70 family)
VCIDRGDSHNAGIRRRIKWRCGGPVVTNSSDDEVPSSDDQTYHCFKCGVGRANQAYVDHRYTFSREPRKSIRDRIHRPSGRESAIYIGGIELRPRNRAVEINRPTNHQRCHGGSVRVGSRTSRATVLVNRYFLEDRVCHINSAIDQPDFSRFQEAMARLPVEQREVIGLVLVEGLSYKEAAEIIGAPIGTITSRLARGRDSLQALLGNGRGAST